MTQQPGPHDAFGRPQDHVPGRASDGPEPIYPQEYGDDFGPQERRGGFSAFPFPSYSTTTRNGTGITVAGCCLPLPLGCLTLTLSAGAYAALRLARSRA